ncbi:unnamed protein product [Echinostoma caproni]|uniref:DHC_N1 domain-containing protein n=1 Tax=Echinostoma caproni TaxID=27848 RepID=A0A183BAI2_9TREM|nr:unnamed protein product [Echinostoma caproni]
MTLGSRKLSQLLRNVDQELARFEVDGNLLHELWVQNLRKAVCTVLAARFICPLNVSAEVTDNAVVFYSQGNSFGGSPIAETADQSSAIATRLAAISARLDRVEQITSKPVQR